MTSDALRAVLCKMPLKKRLAMAAMDGEMFQLAACFHDIDSLLLADGAIFLGGKGPYSATGAVPTKAADLHNLGKIFSHCPAVLRIFVQTKLSREEWQLFGQKADTLQKLYLSSENFSGSSQMGEIKFRRLKSLSILQRLSQPMRLNPRLNADRLKPVLSPCLQRVCLTGVVLLPNALQALFSLADLRSLDLIGTLIDSKEAATVVPTLQQPPRLQEVSLPPSLFSFAKTATVKVDFKWLKVAKLGLYVEYYEEEVFRLQVEKILSKELQTLVLYGNTNRLRRSPQLAKFKFKILFGILESVVQVLPFAPADSDLAGHLVRHSPYTKAELLTNHSESWEFQLATAVEVPPSRGARRVPEVDLMRMLMNGMPVGRPAVRALPVPPRPPAPAPIPAVPVAGPPPAVPAAVVAPQNPPPDPNVVGLFDAIIDAVLNHPDRPN